MIERTAAPVRPVRVVLQGKSFTLQTDEPETHVQAAATLVNERLDDLRRRAPNVPEPTLALLTGLALAGEVLKAQRQVPGNSGRVQLQALADRLQFLLAEEADDA